MRIYSAYDPPPSTPLACEEESLARQSEAEGCDINKIVAQFHRTGMLPQVTVAPMFADVAGAGDYREALERVRYAESVFRRQPADVRAAFGNDAAAFLDAFGSPEGLDRLVELGLIEREAEAEPEPVPKAEP